MQLNARHAANTQEKQQLQPKMQTISARKKKRRISRALGRAGLSGMTLGEIESRGAQMVRGSPGETVTLNAPSRKSFGPPTEKELLDWSILSQFRRGNQQRSYTREAGWTYQTLGVSKARFGMGLSTVSGLLLKRSLFSSGTWVSLGVLVAHAGANRLHDRSALEVLGCNQVDAPFLPALLLLNDLSFSLVSTWGSGIEVRRINTGIEREREQRNKPEAKQLHLITLLSGTPFIGERSVVISYSR